MADPQDFTLKRTTSGAPVLTGPTGEKLDREQYRKRLHELVLEEATAEANAPARPQPAPSPAPATTPAPASVAPPAEEVPEDILPAAQGALHSILRQAGRSVPGGTAAGFGTAATTQALAPTAPEPPAPQGSEAPAFSYAPTQPVDITPVPRQETQFSGPSFRWKSATAALSEEEEKERKIWDRYKYLEGLTAEGDALPPARMQEYQGLQRYFESRLQEGETTPLGRQRRLVNPLGQVQEGTLVGAQRPGPQGDQQRGFRPAQGYVWEDPSDLNNLRVRKQTERDSQTRVQFREKEKARPQAQALQRLQSTAPPEGWSLGEDEVQNLIDGGSLDERFRGSPQRVWNAYRALELKKVNRTSSEAALTAHGLRARDPMALQITQDLLQEGLPLVQVGTGVTAVDQPEMLSRLMQKYTIEEEKKLRRRGYSFLDLSEEDLATYTRNIEENAVRAMSHILALTNMASTDSFDPNITDRIMQKSRAMRPIYAAMAPPAWYTPTAEMAAARASSPADAASLLGDLRHIPRQIDMYSGLSKWGRVLGFTSTAMAGLLEAPDATELFEIDFDGGLPSIHTGYGSRPHVDAIRRGADPFDHLSDWGQMFLGVKEDPGMLDKVVGTTALLLYTFVEPEPFTPLLATAAGVAKGARAIAIPARIRKADNVLQEIIRLQDAGEDAGALMAKLEKLDPGMSSLIGSASQQGLGIRGVGSAAFKQLNDAIKGEEAALLDLRAAAKQRAEGTAASLPAAEAAEAELSLLEREYRLSRLIEARAAARKNSALNTAGLTMEEAESVVNPKTLAAKRTVLDNAVTVFRRRTKEAKKALDEFKSKGTAAEQRVVDARVAYDEVLAENVPAVAPAAARTRRGGVRTDWYPLTETDEAGRTVGVSTLTVQKKDVIAEMASVEGRRGKPVQAAQPTSLGAVGKIEDCTVNDVLIGTRTRTPGRVGKLPKKAGPNRRFEVYLEVTTPDGRTLVVRHPMSNLNASEGGLSLEQAKKIVRQQKIRAGAINANAPDVIRYHGLRDRVDFEKANLESLRTQEPLLRPLKHYQQSVRARMRVEKTLRTRAKELGKAKGPLKGYAARINALTNTAAKEARTLQSAAQLRSAKDILRTTIDNVRAGLKHEQELFSSAVGGPIRAAFTKSMSDIINYDKLTPEQIQGSVVRISGKTLADVSEEGEGVLDLHALFRELGTETGRSGAKAEDLIIDSDSSLLVRALEQLKGGKSKMDLAPGEVPRLQGELSDAIKASHKFETRLKDSAASYAGVWKANADFHALTQRSIPGWVRRKLWGIASSKDPVVFARMMKRAQVGAMSDEMLDAAVAADRILDLGLQELVAMSKGGSMPEEEMIPTLIALFDKGVDQEKTIFGADKMGGGQEELFLDVIGGSTRYQSARAHILDDLRTDPIPAAVNERAVLNTRVRLMNLLESKAGKEALGSLKLEEISDEILASLEKVSSALTAAGGTPTPLAIISRAFFGSGAKGADVAPELTAVAYRLLQTSDTFEEFTTKMARATAAITNHAPGGGFSARTGKHYGGKAYSKVASAFVLAGTQGWMLRQINKSLFAPLTMEQAVTINRILTGAVPDLTVGAKATSAEKLAAKAVSQEQIDDAFRALADTGMGTKERAVNQGEEAAAGSGAIMEKAKLLQQMAKDGTGMNAFVPRQLMDELGRDMHRLINKLLPETPVALDPASVPGEIVNSFASGYTQLSSIWRTSVTTGLGLPNFGYWGNMHMGDLSQMIFQEGWRTGMKVSFNNSLAYVPWVGRGLSDAALIRAGKLPGEMLPTISEAMFNPWLGKLFAGEDFVVTGKNGIQYHSTQLKKMLVEDGIMGTYVNQELVDLFSKALDNTPNGKFLRKWRGRNYEIANHANLLQQRQRAGLYLELLINKGAPRANAASRTLSALYDWKHGVTKLEAQISTNHIPFLRFWALAMRQMGGAAVEPLTKSMGRSFLDAATGRTKIARLGQQIRVFGGVPEMLGLDNEEVEEINSFYASMMPSYMNTRAMLGYGALPSDSNLRDWYIRETGREFDSILWMLPTITMFDTATMYKGAVDGLYALATMYPGGRQAAPDWEARILEPILNTTSPFAQTAIRGVLSQIPGVDLDYYSRSGYRNLSYQEEIVLSPGKHLPLIPDSWNFPMERDKETGRMKMNMGVYLLSNMVPGLLTQAPRWVKALKNPGAEEGWQEYTKWVLGSFTRYGSPTPFSGRQVADMEIRRVNTGFRDAMRGVGEPYSGAREIDDD